MKKTHLFLFVSAVIFLSSLPLLAEQSGEQLTFKKLQKSKASIDGQAVELKVGLGEIGSGSFVLDSKGITTDKYVAVKLYRPGQPDESFNAYLLSGSPVLEMYQNYGTGDRLKKTWLEDRPVTVWGTVYYIGGKDYPVAMVIDKIQPTIGRPKGNLRYSITVSSFENKAGWSGQWDVGSGFTEIMTNALQESGWFLVLGDKQMREEAMQEQDLGASGRVAQGNKTPKIGRMTPAQLLVKGAITHVQESTTGGGGAINIQGIAVGGAKDHAEINITIYLVDSETGQVKATSQVVGKSGRKSGSLGYYGFGMGGVTGGVSGHQNDNVGKACEDAVGQAVDFLIKQLEKIPWEGSIALVKDDKILINRGQREGVKIGQKFKVGSVEQIVDKDTGEVLDVDMKQVGLIEVTEAREKVAYCKALEGGDKIEKGMSIRFAE
jgi:curli biogenesis system outer membrane secretion channel CsgG